MKVLVSFYPMESGFEILKCYTEAEYEQAEKDLDLLHTQDSGKSYQLREPLLK
jgi:hypothetical protein